ncbi:hypothetical protein KKI93_24225, partial [Xenorhabdus bovienii]|uniref:hypothetical protein n=1 Tax=Xenorhabdus bovienii TaxID=40576 RepID=UPI0023B2D318
RHFTSTNAITIPHVFTLIIREKQRDEYVTTISIGLRGFILRMPSTFRTLNPSINELGVNPISFSICLAVALEMVTSPLSIPLKYLRAPCLSVIKVVMY